jgi:recombination protein RecT
VSDLVTASAAVNSKKGQATAVDLIRAQQPAIEAQLAGALDSAAFVRAAITSVNYEPKLQEATASSLLGAIMLAAQLRLEIGSALGHFYLTPRKDGDTMLCLPIIGYRGYIELAYRSGRIDNIGTELVRAGDRFSRGANSERGRHFDWEPLDDDETREYERVIAVAQVTGAQRTNWATLTRAEVEKRRPSYWSSTPWKSFPEAMARKTAIRQLAATLPLSVELGRALQADEQKVEAIDGVKELVVTRTDDAS